ncbi:MAG: hypothetical protein AB7K64_17565 [Variibacter sp.]
MASRLAAAFADAGDRAYAIALVQSVCRLAAPYDYVENAQARLRRAGIVRAVRRHDTAALFDWIAAIVSLQGISDAVALRYMRDHGPPRYNDIALRQKRRPQACPKLGSYWAFYGCGYRKAAATCTEPLRLPRCPLPTHDLRNGRLNQTAYSLYLFVRDVAGGDLVGWIDRQMDEADDGGPQQIERMRASVIGPLGHVHGLADKVLNMTLAELFIGIGPTKPRWLAVGAGMIAVDTLVHNFLARTGVLTRHGRPHLYGAGCYAASGCADVVQWLAERIDAREFGAANPAVFPRLVQNAIWRFCAQGEADVCNGNRIADRGRCANEYCRLFGRCDRLTLRSAESSI